jgi:hypothetical protein
MKTVEKLDKYEKFFSYTITGLIIIAIIHLIGEVIFQSFIKVNDEDIITGIIGLGSLFNSASFSAILVSNRLSQVALKSIPAVISISIGILFIFLAMACKKSKFRLMLIAAILYFVDTLFVIPNIILSLSGNYLISFSVVDYVLSFVFHIIFLAILSFGTVLEFKLK